jgi:hypothetical protein
MTCLFVSDRNYPCLYYERKEALISACGFQRVDLELDPCDLFNTHTRIRGSYTCSAGTLERVGEILQKPVTREQKRRNFRASVTPTWEGVGLLGRAEWKRPAQKLVDRTRSSPSVVGSKRTGQNNCDPHLPQKKSDLHNFLNTELPTHYPPKKELPTHSVKFT